MKKLAGILPLLLLLNACQIAPCGISKDQFLTNFDEFVTKVGEEKRTYSDDQWKAYDRHFESAINDCYGNYESEMSTPELIDFWKNAVFYCFHRYGAALLRELLIGGEENTHFSMVKSKIEESLGDADAVLDEINQEIIGNGGWEKLLEEFENGMLELTK